MRKKSVKRPWLLCMDHFVSVVDADRGVAVMGGWVHSSPFTLAFCKNYLEIS